MKKTKKRRGAGCLKLFLIGNGIFFALVMLVVIVASIIGDETDPKVAEAEVSEYNEEYYNLDKLSEGKYGELDEIFESIDVDEVESIEYDEMLEGVYTYTDEDGWGTEDGYRIKSNGNNLNLYIENDEVLAVEYLDYVLWSEGEAHASLNDYIITSADFVGYTSNAEQLVKESLLSPSTAKFPGRLWESHEWSVYRLDDHVYIESYVDAENAFGATIRNNFQVIVNKDNIVTSLILGDEQLIGQ